MQWKYIAYRNLHLLIVFLNKILNIIMTSVCCSVLFIVSHTWLFPEYGGYWLILLYWSTSIWWRSWWFRESTTQGKHSYDDCISYHDSDYSEWNSFRIIEYSNYMYYLYILFYHGYCFMWLGEQPSHYCKVNSKVYTYCPCVAAIWIIALTLIKSISACYTHY